MRELKEKELNSYLDEDKHLRSEESELLIRVEQEKILTRAIIEKGKQELVMYLNRLYHIDYDVSKTPWYKPYSPISNNCNITIPTPIKCTPYR